MTSVNNCFSLVQTVHCQAADAPALTASFDGLSAHAAREAAVKAEPKTETGKPKETQNMEALQREMFLYKLKHLFFVYILQRENQHNFAPPDQERSAEVFGQFAAKGWQTSGLGEGFGGIVRQEFNHANVGNLHSIS